MPRASTKNKNQGILSLVEADAPEEPEVIIDYDEDGDLFSDLDDERETYNMSFWGREGSGKTTALAYMANVAPAESKILIVNAEGGLKKNALRRLGIDTSKIKVWPNRAKGEEVTRAGLDELYRKIQGDLMRDPNSWFAVGWDSVTEIHTKVTNDVSAHRIDLKKHRDGEWEPDEFDRYFTDLSDYGTMSKMMADLLRKFRDLPCHFVVTALERRDVDEKTGRVTYGPAITPGLQSSILGYTDINLAFKQADEDGPYRALTKGSGMHRAKDRGGSLPRVLVQPWFDRVLAYEAGELTEETDPLQQELKPAAKPAAENKAGGKKRGKRPVSDKDPESVSEPAE